MIIPISYVSDQLIGKRATIKWKVYPDWFSGTVSAKGPIPRTNWISADGLITKKDIMRVGDPKKRRLGTIKLVVNARCQCRVEIWSPKIRPWDSLNGWKEDGKTSGLVKDQIYVWCVLVAYLSCSRKHSLFLALFLYKTSFQYFYVRHSH